MNLKEEQMDSSSESKRRSKWMPAMIVLVVVAMMTAMVEPAAFATDEAAKADEHAAQPVPPAPLRNRKEVIAKIAFVIPPGPAPTTSTPAPRPATVAPPSPQSKGSSKKWIWILVGAGAGAATAILLTRGNETDDQPTITVGSPVVGNPQ